MNENFIVIGKVGKAHGLKGEVYVQLFLDEDQLDQLPQLYKKQSGGYQAVEFEYMKPSGKKFITKFSQVNSREDTDKIRNIDLFVNKLDLPEPDEDEYYYIDLIGCLCYWNDDFIGEVVNVDDYGAGDIFEINKNGKTLFLPFLNRHIETISIENKRIDFKDLEGFF